VGQLLEWFGDPALLALVVSLAALIVSALAWRSSRRNAEQLLDIESTLKRDRLSEGIKAVLVARLVTEDRGNHEAHFLVIENRGEATARQVRGSLDGTRFREHRVWWEDPPDDLQLKPGSAVRFVLAISNECPPPFELDLTWTDDSGQPGHYQTTLTR
jgi:hypothetical protein